MSTPTYQRLKQALLHQGRGNDLPLLQKALCFARKAHKGQKRSSGEEYIVHPLSCAITLAKMKLDANTIIAGLLHDVADDTPITIQDIQREFGADVAQLVSGVTKLGKIKYRGTERYAQNLQKMLFAMAKDIRVIFIKLADRLHNLKTLEYLPSEKQHRIARETLDIYAPMANRLQMGDMRDKLEDLSFRIVNPKEYQWLKNIMAARCKEKATYLKKIKRKVERELAKHHIAVLNCHSRTKHLYGLYKALLERERDITRVYDLIAIRIVVKTVTECQNKTECQKKTVAKCYEALGVLHMLWKPLKGRIKDYIAQPKVSGYQSLHTAVFCDDGEIVEFQIRTQSMHEEAEYGATAHWYYDEHDSKKFDKRLSWVNDLARWPEQIHNPQQLVEVVKETFRNRIFVFTPKGDVIELPEGSTAVDLAYHIHSDVGNQCAGTKINDRIVPLDTILQNGDVAEILLDKQKKGPDPNWLSFVKTTTAKNKIRSSVNTKKYQRLKTMFFTRKED